MSEKYQASLRRDSTSSDDEIQTQALLLAQNHRAQARINHTRLILGCLLCLVPILAIGAFMHQGGQQYVKQYATSGKAKWWSKSMETTAETLLPKCSQTFTYQFCECSVKVLR